MIRILLVDDQNLVQQGIKSLLDRDPEIEVIGTVTDGRSAISEINELRPDIVLLDIEMPGMNGITTTKYITHLVPQTKVIILSSHEDKKYLTQALMAGAKAYILKSSLMTDLKQSILAVNNGYTHIESRLLAKVFDPSNLKSSNSKKAVGRNLKSSRKIKPRTVVKTSVTSKAENAADKPALVNSTIPVKDPAGVHEINSPDPETSDSHRLDMESESIISASENSKTNKTVPKIHLPYLVEANSVEPMTFGDRHLVAQTFHASETNNKLLPSDSLRHSASHLSSSTSNRHHETFLVKVNGKQYVRQIGVKSAIARYKAELKQFWSAKIADCRPTIDRFDSKVAQYRQRVMPLLQKWHREGWLANFGLIVLGLLTVIIIHQVFK